MSLGRGNVKGGRTAAGTTACCFTSEVSASARGCLFSNSQIYEKAPKVTQLLRSPFGVPAVYLSKN